MAHGYTKLEAYSPIPIEELNDIIHKKRTILPKLVLPAASPAWPPASRCRYWASVIEYPMNVGGRPLATWPAFVVPSYELTILFAALTAAIGMIVLNGLPQPYHPVFNVERFSTGLVRQVLPGDRGGRPALRQGRDQRFLQGLGAKGVYDVEE